MITFTFTSDGPKSPHHGVIYLARISSDDVDNGKWEISGSEWDTIHSEAYRIMHELANELNSSKDRKRHFHLENIQNDCVVRTIDVCVELKNSIS